MLLQKPKTSEHESSVGDALVNQAMAEQRAVNHLSGYDEFASELARSVAAGEMSEEEAYRILEEKDADIHGANVEAELAKREVNEKIGHETGGPLRKLGNKMLGIVGLSRPR